MKYLTTEVNLVNNSPHIEEIYCPACSFGESLYLRVITGNIKPKSISVVFEGNNFSSKEVMIERIPTVFEYKIKDRDLQGIRTDAMTKFKIHLYINMGDVIHKAQSKEIIRILGQSFGNDYETDIEALYSSINYLIDKVNV